MIDSSFTIQHKFSFLFLSFFLHLLLRFPLLAIHFHSWTTISPPTLKTTSLSIVHCSLMYQSQHPLSYFFCLVTYSSLYFYTRSTLTMLVIVLPTCLTPIIKSTHDIRFNALCHLHSWIITIYGLHGLHHPHYHLVG